METRKYLTIENKIPNNNKTNK
jgi:hypothetical protein